MYWPPFVYTTTAELSRNDRDYAAHKDWSIYYLDVRKKSLLSPAMDH